MEEISIMCVSDKEEDGCPVCLGTMDVFSVGECNHPICQTCSIRMRVLCSQNECSICRQDLPIVIFTRKKVKFEEIKNNIYPMDRRYKICFGDKLIRENYNHLLENSCPECEIKFQSIGHLERHVRRAHEKFYCELCIAKLTLFSSERKTYTRKELVVHRRKGDADDKSHKGHPSCDLCHKRFFDKDELFKHLRKDHYFCHFCDNDGANLYFSGYQDLREHFGRNHFLCEEGNCGEEKFTSVFRTDLDLKAHRINHHCGGLGRATKQDRTIEVGFMGSRRGLRNSGGRAEPREHEVRYGNSQTESVPNMETDFPSLTAGSTQGHRVSPNRADLASRVAASSGFNVGMPTAGVSDNRQHFHLENTNFPNLHGSSISTPPLVSAPLGRAYPTRNQQPSKQKTRAVDNFPSLGNPEKENVANFVKSENKLVKTSTPMSKWKIDSWHGEII